MATNRRSVNGVLVEQWTNATQPTDPTPAGYTSWNPNGTVSAQRALTQGEADALAALDASVISASNQSTIQQQAQAALAGNRAYLAIATPNTAQITAQVRALTQQHQALIRLALQQFDATN